MDPSTNDGARSTGLDGVERLVDLLVAQIEDDEPVEVRLYPLRLVQGEDDVVADTCRDRGRWSAEELAMHLVEEP